MNIKSIGALSCEESSFWVVDINGWAVFNYMLVLLMAELGFLTNCFGIIFPDFLCLILCSEFDLIFNVTFRVKK